MSVLDRVNRRRMERPTRELTAGQSPEGSLSSIQADRSPIVLRLQAVLSTLNNFVIQNGSDVGFANFGLIMQSLTEELVEELEEKDEETIGALMTRMGGIIAWIGHGDNDQLPEELRIFADEIQPPLPLEP